MPRKRKDRPIERLRSTWTSTADLEETIAAMFPAERSFLPFPDNQQNSKAFGPQETIAVESADTVALDSSDTVTAGSSATVAAGKGETVSARPADTVAVKAEETVVDESSADTVVLGSPDTVAGEAADTSALRGEDDRQRPANTVFTNPEDTVAVGPTDTVAVGRLSGLWQTEGTVGVFPPSRVRRISIAQDALTHAEESVYDTLWGPKNQNRDPHRFVSIGYDSIAKAARVTKMNAKWIVERLIFKGFVSVEALADPLRRLPTTYCVYSYRSALDNMLRSNRLYVVRTGNGVLFAHPLSSTDTVAAGSRDTVARESQATVSRGSTATAPPGQSDTVSPAQVATVAVAETPLGIAEASTPSNVVAAAVIREMGFVDDDAIKTLIRRCREKTPDATDEEIADLCAFTARRIMLMRNIDNPIGLLMQQTPKCFVGESFAIYRRKRQEIEENLRKLYEE